MKEKILKFILDFKKAQPFIFWLVLLSFILACIPFLYYIIMFFSPNKLWFSWIFFIPFLLVCVVSFIAYKTFKKYPRLTKIFSFILNFLILLFQFALGLVIFAIADLFSQNDFAYTLPNEYEAALNSIHAKECIKHFPDKIPNRAKNIELNKISNTWFGSEAIVLKFETSKEYIENELKKYDFKYIEKPDEFDKYQYNSHKPDAMMTDSGRIKTEDFTFYIINDRESEIPQQNSFPYHYGIAVNKDMSRIIYYYTCPD